MKRLLVIALLFCPAFLMAQLPVDSLSIEALGQILAEQVERLAEDGDENADYEELLESYIFYSENRINLNSDEIAALHELGLINVFQYESLVNYRKYYGDFAFLDELEMVDGFDSQTLDIVKPIVYVDVDKTRDKITLEKMAKYGRHSILGRYEQILEKAQGYQDADDSTLLASQNSRYLGTPQKYQLRYNYNYGNRVKAGFVMEKDAGEVFFNSKVSDTVKALLGDRYHEGFDFYGFHLYASNLGIVKDAIVGDYQLSFGQGLTLWSGMSFGKTTAGSSVMKRGSGLRPKTSASEASFMRGAAITLKHKGISGTVFYSIRPIDANTVTADSIDSEEEYASSIIETGYHRTIGEILKRHAISQQVFGGHLAYASKHIEIGYTVHHTILSAELALTPSNYNQFYFQGSRNTNQGVDFRYVRNKFAFFGEGAMSGNAALAGLIGMTVKPAGYINFTMLYRNYDKKYQNFFSNAFGESSRGQGEEGFYLGLEAAPAPYWKLLSYADFFRLNWLTSQVYAPSWGQDYYLRVSHSINSRSSFYLQFRSKTKMKNSADDEVFSHYPIFYTKNSARLSFSYMIGKNFALCNKAEYVHYHDGDATNSHGCFLSQDVSYKPAEKPYSVTLRYALFDTDDYNSRIYTYENDVLYSFSVPSLYGKGMRIYLLGKLKLFDSLSLYARIGRTVYSDQDEIGSGLTLIESNHKTDLKVEAIWKL